LKTGYQVISVLEIDGSQKIILILKDL